MQRRGTYGYVRTSRPGTFLLKRYSGVTGCPDNPVDNPWLSVGFGSFQAPQAWGRGRPSVNPLGMRRSRGWVTQPRHGRITRASQSLIPRTRGACPAWTAHLSPAGRPVMHMLADWWSQCCRAARVSSPACPLTTCLLDSRGRSATERIGNRVEQVIQVERLGQRPNAVAAQ
jgi:hypothetical protein